MINIIYIKIWFYVFVNYGFEGLDGGGNVGFLFIWFGLGWFYYYVKL